MCITDWSSGQKLPNGDRTLWTCPGYRLVPSRWQCTGQWLRGLHCHGNERAVLLCVSSGRTKLQVPVEEFVDRWLRWCVGGCHVCVATVHWAISVSSCLDFPPTCSTSPCLSVLCLSYFYANHCRAAVNATTSVCVSVYNCVPVFPNWPPAAHIAFVFSSLFECLYSGQNHTSYWSVVFLLHDNNMDLNRCTCTIWRL